MAKEITFYATYEIGDIVYHKTDIEQQPMIVTGYQVDKRDVIFKCAYGKSNDGYFYSVELSLEKTFF